ncbi:hypothetical protein WOLCODRAFT_167780 [Wolfiporia cocos MD-104 SS10]|uniref:G-protein coupled receptors family 1 profile domain-containing protein n=1 Tax=Wolfiporia cocos (strain MD-104) TaxID=742152 RepID=A0A2H3JA16_WOLCO|nr:hypothetical protein WOLCODRAFT_167780 [Wolfiporia cocos MD-104 SS10]
MPSITKAQLVSLFLQGLSYGAHAATYVICLWISLRKSSNRKVKKQIHWQLLAIASVLFVVGTIDVSLNLYHNVAAFIHSSNPTPDFDRFSSWVNVLRSVWIFFQTLVANAAITYRCWVLYNRRWEVILLPALLWLANAAVIIPALYYTATLRTSTDYAHASKVHPFVDAYLVLTCAQNVLTTCLVVYRVWHVEEQGMYQYRSKQIRNSPASNTVVSTLNRVLVESALLYTTTVTITMIVGVIGSNAIYDVASLTMEIAGIQVDLIAMRVGLTSGVRISQSTKDTTHVELSTHVELRVRDGSDGSRGNENMLVSATDTTAASDVESGSKKALSLIDQLDSDSVSKTNPALIRDVPKQT